MFPKKYAVICVVAIYLFLLILFFKFQSKNRSYRFECFDQPCVRFCCDTEKFCSSKFINDNFNKSFIPDHQYSQWNASQTLRTFNGKPECFGQLNKVENRKWKFLTVSKPKFRKISNKPKFVFIFILIYFSKLSKNGFIDVNGLLFDYENYCFKESIDNNKNYWNLFICQSNQGLHKFFHFIRKYYEFVVLQRHL